MANPPKPWKAEYAKSARSSCKTCKNTIDKEKLRLGKMVQATQFDGFMPMWNHSDCILKKAAQIKSLDDVEGIELIRWEDQQKIRKYVEAGGPQNTPSAVMECGIEVSQTSRATCRHCNKKITKGEVRISTKPDGQGAKGLAWHHAICFIELSSTTKVEKLTGWDNLPSSDQLAVLTLVKKLPSSGKDTKVELQEHKESLHQSTSESGAKRKRAVSYDTKSKLAKCEVSASISDVTIEKKTNLLGDVHPKADLESLLEAQTKELWALKDDLKKHVTTGELREMLEANGQDSAGSELDLRDRCVDGMLFGALECCPLCSGSLRYSGGMYRCDGYLSAWSKCSYSTTEPKRVKGKWQIPVETSNDYLCKWFKLQKEKKPSRILPPSSVNTSRGNQAANGQHQSSKGEKFGDLKVAIVGLPKESMDEWKRKIEAAGGQVHTKIKKDTNCLVVSEVLDGKDAEMKKAR
ncbi:Poly [ADP-ribose] polymerase 1 [Sarracenia purpurea var. burkii]